MASHFEGGQIAVLARGFPAMETQGVAETMHIAGYVQAVRQCASCLLICSDS